MLIPVKTKSYTELGSLHVGFTEILFSYQDLCPSFRIVTVKNEIKIRLVTKENGYRWVFKNGEAKLNIDRELHKILNKIKKQNEKNKVEKLVAQALIREVTKGHLVKIPTPGRVR